MKAFVNAISFNEYTDCRTAIINPALTRQVDVASEEDAENRMEAGEFDSYLIPELYVPDNGFIFASFATESQFINSKE